MAIGFFSLSGYRGRHSYGKILLWLFVALAVLFFVCVGLVSAAIDPFLIMFGIIFPFLLLAELVLILMAFPLSQRFRDIGWSGAWGLLAVVPIIGPIVAVLMLFVRAADEL